MPNPTRGDVHVNRPLTNISIAFFQNAANFVASRVFPSIPVQKQSDLYFTYSRADFNRDEMRKRAPGTESAGGGYRVDADASYSAQVYAFHKDVPDQIRSNADSPLQLDREATEYVSHKGLIKREKDFATQYLTTGVWGTDITGVSAGPGTGQALQWNDASSTPIEDVAEGKATILEETGFEPNKLVVGYRVWKALKDHPDVIDRIKYSGGVAPNRPAIITREAIAALFEVDTVEVMKAVENTADEGVAETSAFIGGKKALLVYAAPSPGIMVPSAGYTFSWTGYLGAGPEGQRINRFRMEHLKSDRVEIELAFDQKLVAAALGYYFDSIVA